MSVWLEDHTLSFNLFGSVYGIRPCLSMDGRASFKGHVFSWGKIERIETKNLIWHFFAVPYLVVFKANWRTYDAN